MVNQLPKEPRRVGLTDGRFFPCPEKHVCVSTQSDPDDEKHYIEPLNYEGTIEEAKERIIKVIKSLKRTEKLEETENYLRFLITTALLRFKDDVEFYFDDANKTIHFRSQSRIGGYDWNTNMNRMKKIKKLYLETR